MCDEKYATCPMYKSVGASRGAVPDRRRPTLFQQFYGPPPTRFPLQIEKPWRAEEPKEASL